MSTPFTTLATDPGSVADFAAWSKATGNSLLEQGVEAASTASSSRRDEQP